MPTRLGWSALVTGTILAGVGSLLHWPALFVMGLTTTVLCVLAATYLLRPLDLEIERRIAPDRVPKGELAISHLRIVNRSRRPFPGEVGVHQVGDREVSVDLPRLGRGETDLRTTVLPTGTRGRHRIGQLVLRRSDPFGLVLAERRFAAPAELLVLPKVLPFGPLRTTLTRNLDGSVDDTHPRGSMAFHQLREYEPGDDIRKIHWLSTAQRAYSGQLIVRQDVDEAQPYVVIVVDLRPASYSRDSFELALDAAASTVAATARGRAPFELRTTAGTVIGGPNNHSTAPSMEALALAEPTPSGSLRAELTSIQRSRGGAALVVITGVTDPADIPEIARLRAKFQRTVIVSVAAEARPAQHHPGLVLIQGSDEDQLTAAWNVAIRP